MKDLFIGFLSPRLLNTPAEGRELLYLWQELLPELGPERFGNWEPVRQPFDLEAAIASWCWPFLATRRKPSMETSVWMGNGPRRQHSLFSMSVDSAALDKQVTTAALVRFVQQMAIRLQADFAFAHVLTEHDVEEGVKSGTVGMIDRRKRTFSLTVMTSDLQRFIPDLYWATVFGPAYVRHFGRDRLLSAPAHHVEELTYGGVYVQLSEHPLDLRHRFSNVAAVRRRVKEHLDHNSFFDSALHPSERDFSGRTFDEPRAKERAWYSAHQYGTPTFEFEGHL